MPDSERSEESCPRELGYLSLLAHEVRNYLAAIQSASRLAERGASEEHRQWASQVIDRQSKRLANFVDEITDAARLARGKVELHREPLDLGEVITAAVAATRGLFDERSIAFLRTGSERGLPVNGDFKRLERVFANLLKNAAMYSNEGGSVSLSSATEPDAVVVTLCDSGPGFTEKQLARLFFMAEGADEVKLRSNGSIGVGLPVASGLLRLHGGTIEIANSPSREGATCTVRLPRCDLGGCDSADISLASVTDAATFGDGRPEAAAAGRNVLQVRQ